MSTLPEYLSAARLHDTHRTEGITTTIITRVRELRKKVGRRNAASNSSNAARERYFRVDLL